MFLRLAFRIRLPYQIYPLTAAEKGRFLRRPFPEINKYDLEVHCLSVVLCLSRYALRAVGFVVSVFCRGTLSGMRTAGTSATSRRTTLMN